MGPVALAMTGNGRELLVLGSTVSDASNAVVYL
jgi:hypothetical protein